MRTRYKNIVLFYLVLIATTVITLFLARKGILIFNYIFDMPLTKKGGILIEMLKVVQILIGIFFVVRGIAFVSIGFKKSFPPFPFDTNIFNDTRKTVYRGLLMSLFISLGGILLADTISHLALLIIRFTYTF
jgi:hypothetical protein